MHSFHRPCVTVGFDADPGPMAELEISLEDSRWSAAQLSEIAQSACDAVYEALALSPAFEISVLACDDAKIAELNATFRGKSVPTNVLSWPSAERASVTPGGQPTLPDGINLELGDIAIAFDTCLEESDAQNKRFEDHVTHLMVHGTLHLLGYDHENDEDAALMEGLETRILEKLGIADPY